MDNSKNRPNDHLGVNKLGKNIRKSPLHQPSFNNNNNAARQQPQPQIYNISKNDFRNIVQQLTGSSSQEPLPRPPQPPKPQSQRLQKIRPPPLTPINRPLIPHQVPVHVPAPAPMPPPVPPQAPYNPGLVRPPQFGQPSPTMLQPFIPGDSGWTNTADSALSAYMHYLQTSLMNPSPVGGQVQPHLQPPVPGQPQAQQPSSGLLPNPSMPPFPSPRGVNGPVAHMPGVPSPRMNVPLPPMPNIPSPRMNGAALLPSPTSQFLLPSPTGYPNFLSPYPIFSPGAQFPPMTPGFPFSPFSQSGILGPGPQPPPSPGLVFPLSPSGFFPISSPRWRDH